MSEHLVQLSVKGGGRARGPDVCPSHEHDEAATAGAPAERLPGRATARRYWRSLNDLAETPEFLDFVHREFPRAASEWHDPLSRRNFMKLMGASLALAGVYGCERGPEETIVPYVQPPEQAQANRTSYFATAFPFEGYAKGVLVESYQGRPIKIEGNPAHPASLGATDAFTQASILNLYDPDRSQNALEAGQITTWAVFLNQIAARLRDKEQSGGAGVRILTGTVTSPTLADQLHRFLKKYGKARWHQYQPVNRDSAAAGAQQAFGRPVETIYDFSKAQCIVSLDANFLQDEPASLRYARQFINGRRLRKGGGHAGGESAGATTQPASAERVWREVAGKGPVAVEEAPVNPDAPANRLYVVESSPSITGAMADHRLALTPSQVELFAYSLAAAMNVPAANARPPVPPDWSRWIETIAADLRQASQRQGGAALVVAGPTQPPSVHALAHAMNAALGAAGTSVTYTDPVEALPPGMKPGSQFASLRELVADMQRADDDPLAVDTLIIIGGNPAYTAPADIDFAGQLLAFSSRKVSRKVNGKDVTELRNLSVHLAAYYDETSFRCRWHIPHSHFLEAWGDARAFDGTASIIQPLIAPLYNSRSPIELMAALLGESEVSGYEAIRRYWQANRPGGQQAGDFQPFWERSLKAGVIDGTARAQVVVAPQQNLQIAPPAPPAAGSLEVVFRPDPSVWDGEFANNGWLQELPKPLTKITWENAVYMSPRKAQELGVSSTRHDEAPLVQLRYAGRALPSGRFPQDVPVWVVPGHPDGSVTVTLGYGRERAGRVGGIDGETRGFNAYALRTSDAPHGGGGLAIENTGRTGSVACTQDHQVIPDERDDDIVREQTVAQFIGDLHQPADKPEAGAERGHGESENASLYPEYDYSKGRAWGMVVDMNACIGCNACVVACQAENNIPIVGKDQVLVGREMHWLRIDTYYLGDADENPDAIFQPMLCQHCEKAPCEVVCPVGATTHSTEGINEMTYNRCVGTRYCSNNCPYKVRRFNFLQFQDKTTPVLKLMRNPRVTVRDRGVMEKCNYCVQRVNGARIEIEKAAARASDETLQPEERDAAAQVRHDVMRSLQTACQQSCPTEAIVFGDMNYVDPQGRKHWVTRLKDTPANYGVLTELNTQPRTTYLPRLRNPHPGLPAQVHPSPTGRRHPESEATA
jgi:molybdopterin-containing oxidoreductase family iron-sulfur binding subunit